MMLAGSPLACIRRANLVSDPTAPCTIRPRQRQPTPPGPKQSPTRDTHHRVRRDRVDDIGSLTLRLAGRLHHIGVGRTHARTHVLMLLQDLDASIIHAVTGEVLRQLTIDPIRDYQPRAVDNRIRTDRH